ncbi:MAG: hypothetical protein C4530_23770 [Desulfobacteraceae bacterium]|nr:MAG: hypothetical protein C4530_23770 [Desulfobacteraceae bacterium]
MAGMFALRLFILKQLDKWISIHILCDRSILAPFLLFYFPTNPVFIWPELASQQPIVLRAFIVDR